MSKCVYIAGPMRGLAGFNYAAFDEAAARGRSLGHTIVSPAEVDRAAGVDEANPEPHEDGTPAIREAFRRDLLSLWEVDAIAMLPGWQRSSLAPVEYKIAVTLGLEILDARTFDPLRETVLDEAKRLCYGDRNDSYGHPLDDFTRTAAIWAAILGSPVTAEQAIACMIALKLSRLAHDPNYRDSWTDCAGYADCGYRVVEERRRRAVA